MNILIPKWLEELKGVLESVTRISIVVTNTETHDEKIGRKKVISKTSNIINHNFDYKFDSIIIEGNHITATGKEVIIKIPENYIVEGLDLFNEKDEKLCRAIENIEFPHGGTFTFEGKYHMSLDFT